jgi:hypothetical protein
MPKEEVRGVHCREGKIMSGTIGERGRNVYSALLLYSCR